MATHEYPFQGWYQQIAINLTGAWYFLKAVTQQMLQQSSGSMVLVASAVGLITAIAEIVGGVLVPAIAGALSDLLDESAFLWVSAVLAVLALLFTLKLQERPIVE